MLFLTKVSLEQTSQVQDRTSSENFNLKNKQTNKQKNPQNKTLITKQVFREEKDTHAGCR